MSQELKRIAMGDGATALVDDTTAAYLESSQPEPTQQSLDALLEHVHAVSVIRGGTAGGEIRIGESARSTPLLTKEPTGTCSSHVALRPRSTQLLSTRVASGSPGKILGG